MPQKSLNLDQIEALEQALIQELILIQNLKMRALAAAGCEGICPANQVPEFSLSEARGYRIE